LLTLFFYVVHQFVYFLVARGLVGQTMSWSWSQELIGAFVNAVFAAVLFTILDRLKQRA